MQVAKLLRLGGFGCSFFLRARSAQHVFHRVVPFVTGVLIKGLVDLGHGGGDSPGRGVGGWILNRVAVINGIGSGTPEALHNMQPRTRRTAAVERVEPDIVVVVCRSEERRVGKE